MIDDRLADPLALQRAEHPDEQRDPCHLLQRLGEGLRGDETRSGSCCQDDRSLQSTFCSLDHQKPFQSPAEKKRVTHVSRARQMRQFLFKLMNLRFMKLSFCFHSDAKKPHWSLTADPQLRRGSGATQGDWHPSKIRLRLRTFRSAVDSLEQPRCHRRGASRVTQIDRAARRSPRGSPEPDRRACRSRSKARSVTSTRRARRPARDELAVDILVVEIATTLAKPRVERIEHVAPALGTRASRCRCFRRNTLSGRASCQRPSMNDPLADDLHLFIAEIVAPLDRHRRAELLFLGQARETLGTKENVAIELEESPFPGAAPAQWRSETEFCVRLEVGVVAKRDPGRQIGQAQREPLRRGSRSPPRAR